MFKFSEHLCPHLPYLLQMRKWFIGRIIFFGRGRWGCGMLKSTLLVSWSVNLVLSVYCGILIPVMVDSREVKLEFRQRNKEENFANFSANFDLAFCSHLTKEWIYLIYTFSLKLTVDHSFLLTLSTPLCKMDPKHF